MKSSQVIKIFNNIKEGTKEVDNCYLYGNNDFRTFTDDDTDNLFTVANLFLKTNDYVFVGINYNGSMYSKDIVHITKEYSSRGKQYRIRLYGREGNVMINSVIDDWTIETVGPIREMPF